MMPNLSSDGEWAAVISTRTPSEAAAASHELPIDAQSRAQEEVGKGVGQGKQDLKHPRDWKWPSDTSSRTDKIEITKIHAQRMRHSAKKLLANTHSTAAAAAAAGKATEMNRANKKKD